MCKKRVLVLLVLVLAVSVSAQTPNRKVENNTIFSDSLPIIRILVNGRFKYAGRFNFKIRDVAAGERFVFIDEKDGKVKRMFIAQFEGFLPHIDDYFRYSFANAQTFGSHKFRHNTWAFDNRESIKKNPDGESALTTVFLKSKGYSLEDELMMSRFITVPDKAKKHELILFYFENLSSTNHRLSDFYKGDDDTSVWKRISKDLKERSLKSFKIK